LNSDGFVLVKGNDAFLVLFASSKNDLGAVPSTQAKKQYDAAPAVTIPQSEWPESKVANLASDAGTLAGHVVFAVLILGVIGAIVFFIARSRRHPALQAVPVQGGLAVAGPPPVAAVQMSEDRRSWWDGTSWRDAEHEIPPAAQRSGDGKFWWDGEKWRAVP
jgi:hypothetical protein